VGQVTGIEWTDRTWNPVVGCTKVSAGCKNCYAKTLHDQRHKAHLAGKAVPAQYAQPFEVVQTLPERIREPLHWKKPRRIFVNSMSDLFHEDVPTEFLNEVFRMMAAAKRHTFQILTKRPERMAKYVGERWGSGAGPLWEPLPNVHLGVSVEDPESAKKRVRDLLATPAAVRFLSMEPLLEGVELVEQLKDGITHNYLTGQYHGMKADMGGGRCAIVETQEPKLPRINWVIVGGESGPGARPCRVEWIRSIVEQCKAADVPVFVKQDSGPRPGMQGRLPDDIWALKEFPQCLLTLPKPKPGRRDTWSAGRLPSMALALLAKTCVGGTGTTREDPETAGGMTREGF
jgi:protein gp37